MSAGTGPDDGAPSERERPALRRGRAARRLPRARRRVSACLCPAATVTAALTGAVARRRDHDLAAAGVTGIGSLHAARRISSPSTTTFVSSVAFCTVSVTKPSLGSISLRSSIAASYARW